jgi:hypothetical protein
VIACPICGSAGHANHGPPVQLTPDQLRDLGIKPEDLPGGFTIMADQTEPKGRYPRQEVAEGQVHGYIGEVEVYDPPQAEAGYSNAKAPKTTKASAKDSAPAEAPVAGEKGVIGADEGADA